MQEGMHSAGGRVQGRKALAARQAGDASSVVASRAMMIHVHAHTHTHTHIYSCVHTRATHRGG